MTGKGERWHQKNPVLLFLHGGPGLPEYFLSCNSGLKLEEDFTVCWWEQRGSGRSYRPDIPPKTMTLEQMIKDTVAVTNYLRERFDQKKIYLMGHSWGSFLGMHVISQHPTLYHAYFGIGQVADQFESERRAYRFMLDEARRRGEKNTEKALLKYDIPSALYIDMSYIKGIRSSTMDRFGAGFMRKVSTFKDEIVPLLTCRAYTLPQKSTTVKGMMFSLDHLFNLTSKYDLSEKLPKLEVPVFISQGIYDKQTSYDLAKEYFEVMDAPVKRFHTFEKSAHSPQFEEPELFQSLLLEDIQYAKTVKQ
ncbi:MAG: alpha/beta fold hydrolase [Lachnospiraceae bacterium]